jgi:hypothetical protein
LQPGPDPTLPPDVWHLLCERPVELCFIGASITAQRDGWPGALVRMLRADTGQPHVETKNAMGGVGLLFGLANYRPPAAAVAPGVAFIEFSTGDLNLGLTPLAEMAPLLRALLRRTRADYPFTFVVHNWRADFADDDRAGVRRIYDAVAAEFDVPVIANHVMARRAIEDDPATQALWFRDVCHTYPAGAASYARHVRDALRGASATAPSPAAAGPAQAPGAPPEIGFVDAFSTLAAGASGASASVYEYPATGQRFPTLEVDAGPRVRVDGSGRLMGVGFISGPRAGFVEMRVGAKVVRRFRCFDRHSHYRRYILLPSFLDLDDAGVELSCVDEPPELFPGMPVHPDFDAPRTMTLVHLAGLGLDIHRCSMVDR